MGTCRAHIDSCCQCRRDRARLAWMRRFLADPDSAWCEDWRRDLGPLLPADRLAHKEHLASCDACQAVAEELDRFDKELEQRAMDAATRVVWPQTCRLPPPGQARRAGVNGWREP